MWGRRINKSSYTSPCSFFLSHSMHNYWQVNSNLFNLIYRSGCQMSECGVLSQGVQGNSGPGCETQALKLRSSSSFKSFAFFNPLLCYFNLLNVTSVSLLRFTSRHIGPATLSTGWKVCPFTTSSVYTNFILDHLGFAPGATIPPFTTEHHPFTPWHCFSLKLSDAQELATLSTTLG